MGTDDITISVSQESVQSIIKARIQAEIITALSKDGGEVLIARLVHEALNAQVQQTGNTYTKIPFIQNLVNDVVHACARDALKAWAEENKPRIAAAVQKAITKDKSLTMQLVNALLNTIQSSYSVKVAVNLSQRE